MTNIEEIRMLHTGIDVRHFAARSLLWPFPTSNDEDDALDVFQS